jgi:4-hydroxy-3-polyprenylbenzoate decarboxylase
MSPAGVMNLQHELDMGRAEVEALADVVHNVRDIGATIASGSFRANAMIVAPCSMRTCGNRPRPFRQPHHARGGRHAQGAAQAGADGAETPLNLAHLRNMTAVTEMGGIVFPPVPGFYQKPQKSTNWSTTRSDEYSTWSICARSAKSSRPAGVG